MRKSGLWGILVMMWVFSALLPGNVQLLAVGAAQAEPVEEAKGEPVTEAKGEPAGEAQAEPALQTAYVGETQLDAASDWRREPAAESRGSFLSGFEFTGYIRHYMSFNLQNVPETKANDELKMSMNRLSLLLQLKGPLGPANFTAIGRFSREQMTSYLKDLQTLARQTSNDVDFKSHYDENEFRELYLDIPIGERVKLRVGKQQVVWGETDFFQAMDVVHGYDYSWRSFLEPESEELRKPLILGNLQIAVPELKGTLQLLVRPGFDRDKDLGNTYDLFGGRWASNGSKGFDLNSTNRPVAGPPSIPFDYHHPDGNVDDPNYGGRWTGTIGQKDSLSYSLNYYHTQAQDPVIYPDAMGPMGIAFIYPAIDIYGGTLSGKIPLDFLDTIFRAEAAYIPSQPYNTEIGGLVKKDIVRSMFGLDTNLHLERILGTCNASMLSLQIFDTFIINRKDNDLAVNAFGTLVKDHTSLLTGIFTLPYRSDTIKGQIVEVQDISAGGGVFVPSVEFQLGPSWRLKVEADLFYGGKKNDAGNDASMFGSFANNSQLYTRVTYQF